MKKCDPSCCFSLVRVVWKPFSLDFRTFSANQMPPIKVHISTSAMHISPNSHQVYLLVIILIVNIIIIAPWPVLPFRVPDNTDGAARCHGEWQYHGGGTRPVDPPLPGEDSAHCKYIQMRPKWADTHQPFQFPFPQKRKSFETTQCKCDQCDQASCKRVYF